MNPITTYPLPLLQLAPSHLGAASGATGRSVQLASASNNTTNTISELASAEAGTPARLDRAARDFEAVFLRQMLSSLERTTKVSSKPGSLAGQETYGSMIVDVVSEAVAKAGGLGIASVLTNTLRDSSGSVARNATVQALPSSHTLAHPLDPESQSADTVTKVSAIGRNSPQGTAEGAVPSAEIRTSTLPSQGPLADRRIR